MITTRREVISENGETELRGHTVKRVAPSNNRITEIDMRTPDPAPSRAEVPEPAQMQAPAQVSASSPGVRVAPPAGKRDVMPTISTKPEVKPIEDEDRDEQKLSSKTKVMLCVYAATALILAIIVMATGLAIGSVSGEVSGLESILAARSADLADSEATLRHLSDDVTITGEATELGMVKSSQLGEVDLLELGEATEYEAHTNGFDEFCDFLSGIFGRR